MSGFRNPQDLQWRFKTGPAGQILDISAPGNRESGFTRFMDGNSPGEIAENIEAAWVELPNGWLSVQTSEERYIASGDSVPYQFQFIDAVNGNDANSGSTELLPKRTLGAATKAATYGVLMKRGQTHVWTDPTNPYPVVSGHHVAAYGDITAPRPIVQFTGSANTLFDITGNRTGISIADLQIDLTGSGPNSVGARVVVGAGQVANDVAFRRLRFFGGSATGYANATTVQGMTTTSQTSNTSEIYDIVYEDCASEGTPGHGFMITGGVGKLVSGVWHGVDYFGCTADGCGIQYDTHGFSSYSAGAFSGTPSSGIWTSAGGNVYFMLATDATVYNRNVWDIQVFIIQLADGSWRALLQNTATPLAPAAWEYGFDSATQKISVNLNGESLTASSHAVRMCVQAVRGVRWINCTAKNQQWPNTTAIQEGHGFAFDDCVSNSSILYCKSINNAGAGVSINNGANNTIFGSRIGGNKVGQINNGFNLGQSVGRNLIMQGSNSPAGMVNCQNSVKDAPGFTANVMNLYRNAFIYTGIPGASAPVAIRGSASGNPKQLLARNNFYYGCQPALTTTSVRVSGVLDSITDLLAPASWTNF